MKRITSPIVIFMDNGVRSVYSLASDIDYKTMWPLSLRSIGFNLEIELCTTYKYLNESQLDYV